MLRSLDTYDSRSPDSSARNAWSLDAEPARIIFGAALDAFWTARAAEGASPKTVIWYRMVLGRAARDLGARRQLDALTADEVRAWLVTLRQTLAHLVTRFTFEHTNDRPDPDHLRKGIDSHLVGVNTSVDEVFQPASVAIAHIYRAKGNEAPMVYAVDSQHAASDFNAVTRRNTLFTAITRSRAWVRITGWGEEMETIRQESAAVFAKEFKLEFTIPTAEQLAELRHIHRDRPAGEDDNDSWGRPRPDQEHHRLPHRCRSRALRQ